MFQRTKKFFKKSIQTVKSYFSEGYEKLPKSPSYNGHQYADFNKNNIYSEFVDQWEATDRIMAITYENNVDNIKQKKPSMLMNYHEVHKRNQQKKEENSSSEREETRFLVTRRLKELEVLDSNNVDHVLDIQEIVHFYSRLTCPIYREMVEKFFMEMYSEVFSLPLHDNPMPRRMSIRV